MLRQASGSLAEMSPQSLQQGQRLVVSALLAMQVCASLTQAEADLYCACRSGLFNGFSRSQSLAHSAQQNDICSIS